MPKPKPSEGRKDYLARCMADPAMNEKHPDEKQRYAVCNGIFEYEAVQGDILALGSEALVSAGEPSTLAARVRPSTTETRLMAEKVLEGLTDVSAQWLGNATPIVEQLISAAQIRELSDSDFIQAVERAAAAMPDLFDKLKPEALAKALEEAMGTAMLNGAVGRQRDFEQGH